MGDPRVGEAVEVEVGREIGERGVEIHAAPAPTD